MAMMCDQVRFLFEMFHFLFPSFSSFLFYLESAATADNDGAVDEEVRALMKKMVTLVVMAMMAMMIF